MRTSILWTVTALNLLSDILCEENLLMHNLGDQDRTLQTLPQCNANPSCVGIRGNCCPTNDGTFLDCCTGGQPVPVPVPVPVPMPTPVRLPPFISAIIPPVVSASCLAHPQCNNLGLQGNCCPAANGQLLACCSNSSQAVPVPVPVPTSVVVPPIISSSCLAHPQCSNLGLKGNCCPAANGQLLACCSNFPQAVPVPVPVPVPTSVVLPPVISASCLAHPQCSNLGLTGNCCPGANGKLLACCSNFPQAVPVPVPVPTSVVVPPVISASCVAHPQCSNLGLTGNCCPGANGKLLACCSNFPQAVPVPVPVPTSVVVPPVISASCLAHPQCSNLGLTGNCCPAANGQLLSCCSSFPQPVPAPVPKPVPVPVPVPIKSPARLPTRIPYPNCSRHKRCQNLGLTGVCCPTRDGVFLDCCGSPPPQKCFLNSACVANGLTGNCCPTNDGVYLSCCNDTR